MPFGAIALAGAFINTAAGMYQGYKTMKEGKAQAEQYRADIENYERAERENAFRGLRVPTDRAEIAREDIGRSTASAIDAVSKGGVRAYGALPQILSNEGRALDNVAAFYEEKKLGLQKLIAQDDAHLRQMQFNEEQQELQMLGQGLSGAMQMEQSGRDAMWGAAQQGVGMGANIVQGIGEQDLVREMYGIPEQQSWLDKQMQSNYAKRKGTNNLSDLNRLNPINTPVYQTPDQMELR